MAPAGKRRKNAKTNRWTKAVVKHKDELITLELSDNKECMFCGHKEISEKLYGWLYQFNDIVVHYFCILLSSRAVQNGEDKDGILGFLIKDIRTELTRGSRETCIYCKKTGATISCCEPRCRKIFHLPCGMENGSMHQFYQKFMSFCSQHRMTQAVDIVELQNNVPVECTICKLNVLPTPLPDSIWAPCCRRNAWFHRKCIQDLALSTGYFFKCPLCNNVDKFKSRMLYLGIYIPSRDASWETVPNAYHELLERHNSCDAVHCMCPHRDKRKYQQESGSWEIILCYTCGSSGTHKLCSSLKVDQEWSCNECMELTVLAKGRQLQISNGNVSTTHGDRTSQIASSSNSATSEASRSSRIREAPRNVEVHQVQRKRRNRGAMRNVEAREALVNGGNQETTSNRGVREALVNGRNRETTRNRGVREALVNGENQEVMRNVEVHQVQRKRRNRGTMRNVEAREALINGGNPETTTNVDMVCVASTSKGNPVSIRESLRLNNSNREINYKDCPSTSTSISTTGSASTSSASPFVPSSTPIYVSDENSNDSDVLIVTYVEPPIILPKQTIRQIPVDYLQLQFTPVVNDPNYPRICNVGSLGEAGTFPTPRRFIADQIRNRGLGAFITDNIDLTSSDENDADYNDNNNNIPE